MKFKVPIIGVTVLFFMSCASVPKALDLDPSIYEDSNIIIEYAIGLNVYNISIYNKTNEEIVIVNNRASIISVYGETNSLNLNAFDTHIPPKSKIILSSKAITFFSTDIWAQFKSGKIVYGSRSSEGYYLDEYAKQFKNYKIRLYIPLIINEIEKIYDIELVIKGVKQYSK